MSYRFFKRIPLLLTAIVFMSCSFFGDDSYLISKTTFMGGINPQSLEILIRHDGQITITGKSLYSDPQVTITNVPATLVEDLHTYIIQNGYLDLNEYYDCAETDSLCLQLRDHYPADKELQLLLDDDGNKFSVRVAVFGSTETHYLEYPVIIDSIVAKMDRIILEGD